MPLSDRDKPLCVVCTSPFVVDFEIAAALWEPRLFPICSGALPALDSIVRYSVVLELEQVPGSESVVLSPIVLTLNALTDEQILTSHFTLALVLGLPKDLDAGLLDFRKDLVGSHKCKTSIHIVSTFDYEPSKSVATFLLAKNRFDQFKKLGYEVAIVNTSFWRVQSRKVKCQDLQVVGDVDQWDRDQLVRKKDGRRLSYKEESGWAMAQHEDGSGVMPPNFGPFGGLDGLFNKDGSGAGASGSGGMPDMATMMAMMNMMGMGMPKAPQWDDYDSVDE